MGNFNKFNKGGRGGFDRGQRPMFHAVCSKCGQDCEVPFKPTGDRPVFCNNCFKTEGAKNQKFAPKSFAGGGFHGGGGGGNAGGGVSKAQIDSLNFKLDKIISLLSPADAPLAKMTEPKAKKETVKKEKAPAKKAKAKKK